METMLVAGIGLIVLGLVLIFIEAFVPSGGVIAIVALICAIVGVGFLFRYDALWGVIGTLSVLILGPLSFFSALSIIPNTKFGKQMMGPSVEEIAMMHEEQTRPQREARLALLDQEGIAKTALRPVGVVEINGERHEAIALGGIIDQGSPIRVVKTDGIQISVRAI